MSDWLDKFKKQKETPEVEDVGDLSDDYLSDDYDEEIFDSEGYATDDVTDNNFEDTGPMVLENFDMNLDEIVEDISKTNKYIFATLEALNRELKAGFMVVRSENQLKFEMMEGMINSLEDKVTRSLLAMEDGNEKRALLLANALEEINDLVADPDGMTDVFKVAPDIAMNAMERDSQGALGGEKPFNPDDEIYLPEATPGPPFEKALEHLRPAVKNDLTTEEEFLSINKIADMELEENPTLLTDELTEVADIDDGGAGEIQLISVPSELSDYNERDYNAVMDYINGDIKWNDIMKYAGGMKQAKALVDPVKLFHNIQ